MKAALAGGAIAFVLYHFYPAAGPIYAFGQAFPASLPDPATLASIPAGLAMPGAARNCMPSVHFFWAILAAAEARGLGRAWRACFVLFAVLTAFATIALGEHYVIDLVIAVPFTLCVHALFSRERSWVIGWRATAISGGSRDIVLAVVFADMDTAASYLFRALDFDSTHHCRERAAAPRTPLLSARLMAETRLFRL